MMKTSNKKVFGLTNTQKICLINSDYIHPELYKDKNATTDLNIFMFHGTRGSSKTETIVREVYFETLKGFGNEWKALIIRRNNKDLVDIFKKFKKFLMAIKCNCEYINSTGNYEIRFKTGEVVLFRQMQNIKDYDKIHGHEYQYVVLEEATLWVDVDEIISSILTTMRTNYNLMNEEEIEDGLKKRMIMKLRISTNPFGTGKEKLKRMFIDRAPSGVAFIQNKITHMHFKSSFIDNRFLPNNYANTMSGILNKQKRAAWKYGDWSAKAQGAFGDRFDAEVFVKRPFKIPRNWYVDRAMDWGTAAPYSMLYFAECDGTEVNILKRGEYVKFKPPKGSIIVIGEFSGADYKKGRNVGLNHTVAQACKMFTAKENEIKASILEKGHRIGDGFMDYAIKARTGHELTIEDLFKQQGFYFNDCSKGAGSRGLGVQRMQELMKNTLDNSSTEPHIYFFDTCPEAIEDIFALEYSEKNPEDVETDGVPDHSWDCLRYRLLTKTSKMKIQY